MADSRTASAIPHGQDRAMKWLFGHPRAVADLLRDLIPDGRIRGFDPRSLVRLPDSRVDGELQERHSDITWQFDLEDGERVVLILEAQSTVDPEMAVRMARQVVMHCERERRLNPGRPPPRVLPVVFYTGSRPWRAPRSLWEPSEGLLTYLSGPCYFLTDVRRVPLESLPERSLASLMVRMMVTGEPRELMNVLESAKLWLEDEDAGLWRDCYTWATMVLAPFEIPHRDVESPKELVDMVNENLARRLEEIKQETRAEGQRSLLHRQIARKFGGGIAAQCTEKLADPGGNGRMQAVGDLIIDCRTGEEFLAKL